MSGVLSPREKALLPPGEPRKSRVCVEGLPEWFMNCRKEAWQTKMIDATYDKVEWSLQKTKRCERKIEIRKGKVEVNCRRKVRQAKKIRKKGEAM